MQIQKQIEEAVERVDKEKVVPNGYITLGTGENRYYDEEMAKIVNERVKKFLRKELSTIATKSAEVERERILGLASDISDELTNANVPVIHPGELGEHEPDDVWEVSGNQTAHAFYGMLEQKIKGGKNGK